MLRAQAFELVDPEGRVRARLGFEKDESILAFFNRENKTRVSLGVDDDWSAMLRLADECDEAALALYMTTDGTPHIAFITMRAKRRGGRRSGKQEGK